MLQPLRILFDNSIFADAAFTKSCYEETEIRVCGVSKKIKILGVQRKQQHKNEKHQKQIDAIYTIGRLVREGRIKAFEYSEVRIESDRGYMTQSLPLYALEGCNIESCSAPLERSKFMQADSNRYNIKGGREDKRKGLDVSFSQIAFCKWLCGLSSADITRFISYRRAISPLTNFEVDSLQDLDWYQSLQQRTRTTEHLPDFFHLWTARRNGLDAFLTLDSKFAELVINLKKEKNSKIEINPDVLLPLQLLEKLGIGNCDPIPFELGRFYPLSG